MTLLRQLRRAGAKVRLNDQGKLAIKGTPDDLRPKIKADAAALVAALKAEESFGVLYSNSELYWRLDELFVCVSRIRAKGIAPETCLELLRIVGQIDSRAAASMVDGAAAIAEYQPRVAELLDTIQGAIHPPLEGDALGQLAATVFEVAPPVAAPFAAPAPKVDLGAFISDPDAQEALL